MPKIPNKAWLRFYEKDNSLFAEELVLFDSFSEVISRYLEYVDLLANDKFTYIYRVDVYRAGRVLLSSQTLRSYIDQKNLTINFNPY